MYMYYLLGYMLIGKYDDFLGKKTKDKRGRRRTESQFFPHNLFSYLPECVYKQVSHRPSRPDVQLSSVLLCIGWCDVQFIN